MTIKKPMKKAPSPAPAADVPEMPAATGGATIADRFKLDAPAEVRSSGGKGATIAAIVGLVALGIAGVLTFILYQHWEFLKGA